MYVKITTGMGTSNINLTMDYIQEVEEYSNQVLDDEETKQFFFTSFRFISPLFIKIFGQL